LKTFIIEKCPLVEFATRFVFAKDFDDRKMINKEAMIDEKSFSELNEHKYMIVTHWFVLLPLRHYRS